MDLKKNLKLLGLVILAIAVLVGGYFGISFGVKYFKNQLLAKKLVNFNADFSRRLKTYAINSGCTGSIICPKLSGEDFYLNFVESQFKARKICGNSVTNSCFPARYNLLRNSLWANLNEWTEFKFVTEDKASVLMKKFNYCKNYSLKNKSPLNCVVGYLFVDVNGTEEPNIYGRDLFYFYLTGPGEIIPMGSSDDKTGSWQSSGKCVANSGTGEHCAARILEQNGKMLY